MRFSGPRAACVLLPLCVLIFAPAAEPLPFNSLAQEPAQPERRVTLVKALAQTDVLILDQTGHFAEGLTKEQFEVLLEGKSQTIISAEPVTAGSAEEEIQWPRARGAAASPAGAGIGGTGRAILFFIDDLNMSAASIAGVRAELTRVIDTVMGPGDRAVIASASKRVGFLQQLTGDKATLRAAAAQLAFVPPPIQDYGLPSMNDAQAAAIEDDDPVVMETFVQGTLAQQTDKGKEGRRRAERRVKERAAMIAKTFSKISETTLSQLSTSLTCFAEAPGRKAAFVISDGFYLRDRHSDSVDLTLQTLDIAGRGRIIIYTINSRGLAAAPPKPAARTETTTTPGSGTPGDLPTSHGGLGMLAVDTGGRFFRTPGSLKDAVAAALAETSRYYLLGWRFDPAIVRLGNSRSLKVVVKNRPDLRIQLRQNSVDLARILMTNNADTKDVPTDELLTALRAPKPLAELPVYVYCGYAQSAEKTPQLTITLQATVDLAGDGAGLKRGDLALELMGATFNEEGLTVDAFRGPLSYSDVQNLSASTKQVDLSFTTSVSMKPGIYQVRAAMKDPRNGRIGSAIERCEVPLVPSDSISLGSLFFVFASSMQPLPAGATPRPAAQMLVNAKRRFAAGSEPTYFFYCYSLQPLNDEWISRISVQSRIFSGETEVPKVLPQPTAEKMKASDTAVRYFAQLPTSGLAPGNYTLEVTAKETSSQKSAKQRLTFQVQ